MRLAELTALLHDIGRFEQYTRFGTFVDRNSINHADLGVSILREKEVLSKLETATCDLVLRVITYHNRAALPTGESAGCLFFSRLLRDADKLDIWRVVTDYYRQKDQKSNTAIELGLPDIPGFTDTVVSDLVAGRIVDVKQLRTLNDFKLLQVGWVYDLNFVPTFRRLKERGYLDRLRAALPETEITATIFAAVNAYLLRNGAKEQGPISRPISDHRTP